MNSYSAVEEAKMTKITDRKTGVDFRKIDRIKKSIPDGDTSQIMAALFKILGDASRLRIISALENDELTVSEIAELTSLAQSLVSHHLQGLRQMELVRYRRDGKLAYYELSDSHVRAMLSIARDHARERE
jgi:ArsR family transcriptional regulator, lead/cadmium/zinc/bismuth-responsive transcriptional repressor